MYFHHTHGSDGVRPAHNQAKPVVNFQLFRRARRRWLLLVVHEYQHALDYQF